MNMLELNISDTSNDIFLLLYVAVSLLSRVALARQQLVRRLPLHVPCLDFGLARVGEIGRMDDEGLHHLVAEVNHRQSRVSVGAGKLKMLKIRPADEEFLQRGVRPSLVAGVIPLGTGIEI